MLGASLAAASARRFQAAPDTPHSGCPLTGAVVLRDGAGAREGSGQSSCLGDRNIYFRLLLAGQSGAAAVGQGAHLVLPLSTEGTNTHVLTVSALTLASGCFSLLGNISFLFFLFFLALFFSPGLKPYQPDFSKKLIRALQMKTKE